MGAGYAIIKYLFIGCNTLFALGGVMLLVLDGILVYNHWGSYFRTQLHFRDYTVFVIGLYTVAVCFMGCVGAVQEKSALLVSFATVLGCTLAMNLYAIGLVLLATFVSDTSNAWFPSKITAAIMFPVNDILLRSNNHSDVAGDLVASQTRTNLRSWLPWAIQGSAAIIMILGMIFALSLADFVTQQKKKNVAQSTGSHWHNGSAHQPYSGYAPYRGTLPRPHMASGSHT